MDLYWMIVHSLVHNVHFSWWLHDLFTWPHTSSACLPTFHPPSTPPSSHRPQDYRMDGFCFDLASCLCDDHAPTSSIFCPNCPPPSAHLSIHLPPTFRRSTTWTASASTSPPAFAVTTRAARWPCPPSSTTSASTLCCPRPSSLQSPGTSACTRSGVKAVCEGRLCVGVEGAVCCGGRGGDADHCVEGVDHQHSVLSKTRPIAEP